MPTVNHPIVGRVSYRLGAGGKLILESGWAAKNVGIVEIPELKGVPTYGDAKFSGRVPFYKPAMPQLKSAFEVIGKLGLRNHVIFWSGSFVPRLKRGGSTPSNHSYATAFDINHQQNPFRRPIAPKGTKGSVVELLPIFRAFGFECGADWKNTPDGMHFEIKRLMSAEEIEKVRRKFLGGTTVAAKPVVDVPTLKINGVLLQGAALGANGWTVDLSDAFQASKVKYSLERTGNDYEIKTQ